MELAWKDLGAALALYLVLEGVLPFLGPATLKRSFAALISVSDATLRWLGLASMITGCVLLYLIRS